MDDPQACRTSRTAHGLLRGSTTIVRTMTTGLALAEHRPSELAGAVAVLPGA